MSLREQFARLDDIRRDLNEVSVNKEKIGWFKQLIACYSQEHDWESDDDPDATSEMLNACRDILARLERDYADCD